MIKESDYKRLKFYALCIATQPLLVPLWCYHVLKIPGLEIFEWSLDPFYFILMVGLFTSSYGLSILSRWSWYVVITFQAFLAFSLLTLLPRATTPSVMLYYLPFIALQSLMLWNIKKIIKVPFLYPQIRWWEDNPLLKQSTHVDIVHHLKSTEKPSKGELLDVSLAGCFIKSHDTYWQENQEVILKFSRFQLSFEIRGIITWLAKRSVTHPQGIGVRFIHLSSEDVANFRILARRLKKMNQFYKKNRYRMKKEEFLKLFAELEEHFQHDTHKK